LKVALAQLEPLSRDVPAGVERACALLERHRDSDLLVLPELFLGGYQLERIDELAIRLDGPELAAIGRAAARHGTALVVGAFEAVDGGVANSALCVGATGELAGTYRKVHLFGAESDAFVPGDEIVLIELAGVRCGVMICFDVEFPEMARTLAARGAECLVTISANMTPFERDHDVFVHARAMESGAPHIYANRVGCDIGERFVGNSMVVSAEGETLVRAGERPIVLELDLDVAGRADPRTHYLGQLRGGLYEPPQR
jgi:predicted amidohydrolase